VSWAGALIAWLDRTANRETASFAARRAAGVAALLVVIAAAAGAGVALDALARALGAAGVLVTLFGAASLLAAGSLDRHVAAVAAALEGEGLAGGRRAVARIVGRDPASLDEAGVARAAIESLAENASDGVVAPAFWFLVGGLPGLAAYKAVNTADSMIGHLSERHRAFGWAAARLDDLVNLPASRITAGLIVAAAALTPGASVAEARRILLRDARLHRSPNAGWPEAATAGALGLKLAGPRRYGARIVDDPWLGDGREQASAADIRRALALYRRAVALGVAPLGLAGLALLIARA
jgi:adenosylcobinamide-phosphate synthase